MNRLDSYDLCDSPVDPKLWDPPSYSLVPYLSNPNAFLIKDVLAYAPMYLSIIMIALE
jgi:hypothetical protein